MESEGIESGSWAAMHPIKTTVFLTTCIRCESAKTALLLSPMLYGPQLIAFLKTTHKLSQTDLVRVTKIDVHWPSRHRGVFSEAKESWNAQFVENLMADSIMNPYEAIHSISQADAFHRCLMRDGILRDRPQDAPRLVQWTEMANGGHLTPRRTQVCLVPKSKGLVVGLQDGVSLDDFEDQLNGTTPIGIYGLVEIEADEATEAPIPFECVVTMSMLVCGFRGAPS